MLSINCDTIEADHNKGHVNEQLKQDRFKTKVNLPLEDKNNQEIDYFFQGQKKSTWWQVPK